MSEEEKKAIESLRKNRGVSFAQADIISNLIDRQQKEIKRLNSIINTDNIINKERAELIEQQQREIEKLKREVKTLGEELGYE